MNETTFITELWNYARTNSMYSTINTFRPKIKELVIYKIKNQFTISNETTVLTGKAEEIMDKILEDVCRVLEYDKGKILHKRRHVEVSYLRHLFVKLCIDHRVSTLTGIGKFMNRDHTTIIHSMRVAESLIQTKEPTFMALWVRYIVNGDPLFTGIYDKSLIKAL